MKQCQDQFTYGAVLKVEREHTRGELRAMLQAMKDTGMNTVVVWPAVYWWEPQGAHYPYQTGRNLLADAGEIGIRVVMELAGQITALEYAPDFVMKDEYYCVDRKGSRDECSMGYGYLNFNHPEVHALIERQYGKIAREYREFPALKGYDIWNETQFTSFDEYTLACFRDWLKAKYGTLDALNASWDRAYRDWSQVRFTQWMWSSVMTFVDYQQFHKDNIGMILRWMRAAIEAVDAEHEILADNIHASVTMDGYYDRPTDDWCVAREVDQYGISFYPKFLSQFTPPFLRHQTMTGAHSASPDGRFAISEMQTHHATMFNPEGSVSPEELWQWCWEAVSHGANGIIYWKWNPFRKGVQTFGRGLVDLQGRDTPRTETARRLGRILQRETALQTCRAERPVAAILFDRLNQDFIKAYTVGFGGRMGAPASLYHDALMGLYRTLWEHDVPVKFVTPEELESGAVNGIPLLFVTTQVTADSALARALLDYAGQGGVCICDGKFAEVNETGLLNFCIPGAGLSETLGFELLDMEEGELSFTLPDGQTVRGSLDRRKMQIDEAKAEIVARYMDGEPAVLASRYGKGKVCYISTYLWAACKAQPQPGAYALVERLFGGALPMTVRCDAPQVRVQHLTGPDAEYVFAFNYGEACTAAFSAGGADGADGKNGADGASNAGCTGKVSSADNVGCVSSVDNAGSKDGKSGANGADGENRPAGPAVDVLTGEIVGTAGGWQARLDGGAVGIYRLPAGERVREK